MLYLSRCKLMLHDADRVLTELSQLVPSAKLSILSARVYVDESLVETLGLTQYGNFREFFSVDKENAEFELALLSHEVHVFEPVLGIRFLTAHKTLPFFVDFNSSEFKKHAELPLLKFPLIKLLNKEGDLSALRIYEAMAGFGADSYQLLRAGAKVFACEKNLVSFLLLKDAISRAAEPELFKKFQLKLADFNSFPYEENYEVIYLDPMFDSKRRKAAPSKGMQLLDAIGAESLSEESLQRLIQSQIDKNKTVLLKRHSRQQYPLVQKANVLCHKGASVNWVRYWPK